MPARPPRDSAPVWPTPYRTLPRRTLALWRDGELCTEYDQLIPCTTLGELESWALLLDLIVYVDRLVELPWLDDILLDAGHEVLCNERAPQGGLDLGNLASCRLRLGTRARWIVQASAWGAGTKVCPSLLCKLRRLFEYCGVGDHPTPSALGQAKLREQYPADIDRMGRPPRWAWEILDRSLVGGRVDTIKPKQYFDLVYELDINNAYAWAATRVPVGTIGYHKGEPPERAATAYCRATWRVPAGVLLPLAPLPVRGPLFVSYPTTGEHTGWYWKEELDRARSLGVDVAVHECLYWRQVSGRFSGWADHMDALRRDAPKALSELVKLAVVAGLGRFACDRASIRLSLTYRPGGVPYTDPKLGPTWYWLYRKENGRADILMHVYSHIMMRCRLRLFDVAHQAASAGRLVASNYDAVYVTEAPAPELIGAGLGAWKSKALHGVTVDAPRHLRSREKVRLPGIPYDVRQEALA